MRRRRVRMPDTKGSHDPLTTPAADEGNLAKTLTAFASWRSCSACGTRTLYTDENLQSTTRFLCGRCVRRLDGIAERLRPSLPDRVLLHLAALFGTANDNAEGLTGKPARQHAVAPLPSSRSRLPRKPSARSRPAFPCSP
jgi:hypothetical protein